MYMCMGLREHACVLTIMFVSYCRTYYVHVRVIMIYYFGANLPSDSTPFYPRHYAFPRASTPFCHWRRSTRHRRRRRLPTTAQAQAQKDDAEGEESS